MVTARSTPPLPATAATPPRQPFKGSLSLQTPLGAVLSESRIRLLEAIDRVGSLNRAAREVPLSYKAAWDALDAMNEQAPEPLVLRATGGAGGGGTRLTEYARQLIALYRAMESSQQDVLDRLPALPDMAGQGDMPTMRNLIRRMTMKTSARNQFATVVQGLSDLGGLIDVTLSLGQGDSLIASITPESAREMGLTIGMELYALIKAPSVRISPKPPRQQAHRNRLNGQLSALQAGQTHTGCQLTLASGRVLRATVSNEEAAQLTLGEPAWAVFDTESVVLVSFA